MSDLLFGYFLGLVTAIVLVVYHGNREIKRVNKLKDKLLEELKTRIDEGSPSNQSKLNDVGRSIQERLLKASEIAQMQMILRARAEQPSANALDSKYKNGLIGELTTLEHQKLDILKSILIEGYDPKITVMGESGKEEMLLSDYVNEALTQVGDAPISNTPPPLPQEQIAPGVKKIGKFVVYDGGSNGEGGGTTH